MIFKNVSSGGEIEVELLARNGPAIQVRVGEQEFEARYFPLDDGSAILELARRRIRVAAARRKDSWLVALGTAGFEFVAANHRRETDAHGLITPEVTAPMPGKVLKILVKEGDRVEAGQALAVLEAMKMETTLTAEGAASVKRIAVAAGQTVDHGALLIELSPINGLGAPEAEPEDS